MGAKDHSCRRRSSCRKLLLGVCCGFFLATWLQVQQIALIADKVEYDDPKMADELVSVLRTGNSTGREDQPKSNFLYVGVMTTKKYLSTRALAVHRTWARSIPGHVTFFSSAGTKKSNANLPLVTLSGVDDTYPPQKKSFLMLKYMHDKYIDQYEWFMRIDDDAYVKGDKLEGFLRSVNSSNALYIGQAGQGKKEEVGKLHLKSHENYCIGGPGVVFSRETLRKVVPHIRTCLKNLYTLHEDVEIGRCVETYAKIKCTWSYEMRRLFYQEHLSNDAFKGKLDVPEVHGAITLHPIKTTRNLYRVHRHGQTSKLAELLKKADRIERQIRNYTFCGEHISEDRRLVFDVNANRFLPGTYEDGTPWSYAVPFQKTWSTVNPALKPTPIMTRATARALSECSEILTSTWTKIGIENVQHFYINLNPRYGMNYKLDLEAQRSREGNQSEKATTRHFWIRQVFNSVRFRDQNLPWPNATKIHRIIPEPQYPIAGPGSQHDAETVHIIITLHQRLNTFRAFMENFEKTCLQTKENVKLTVVLFGDNNETLESIDLFSHYQNKYRDFDLRLLQLKKPFSRGLGLQRGADMFPGDALLYFMDVDILFTRDSLDRCRWNAKQGRRVYYPVFFNLFDPDIVNINCTAKGPGKFVFDKRDGFFRTISYGMVCLYHSDFKSVGGYDLQIEGWGKEDLLLCDAIARTKHIEMFRAPDVGLVHVYHPKVCDPTLESEQYKMCLGSKALIVANTAELAKLISRGSD